MENRFEMHNYDEEKMDNKRSYESLPINLSPNFHSPIISEKPNPY